ncbi:MAG: tripartite tricarboxylate transporter substrate binding protein [Pigmentiphaga sp.]|nr:tripartite tricarboxylate transporter substrate binding protein [Pigmentiphaga sp.]
MKPLFSILALTLAGLTSPSHAANDFPQHPLELIVPFAAGGGLDQNARSFADALGKVLGQSVVVNNVAGAAGTIGMQRVARTEADGHILAFTPAVPISSGPHRLTSVTYTADDFDYVCQVFDNIFAIAVPAASPYQNLGQLLEGARQSSGKLSYGTSGVGSIPHLGTANIEHQTGVSLNHVPYKGDGPMLQDLLGDRLDFGAVLASSITGQIQAGQLRLIAVYADKRHPAFPDVPTLGEAGVPVVQLSFGGVVAPRGLPPPVLAALEKACADATQAPAYLENARRANQVVDYISSKGFRERILEDSRQQADTLKRLGLDKQAG